MTSQRSPMARSTTSVRSSTLLSVADNHRDRIALRIARDALLGREDRGRVHRFIEHRAHVHAGQQHAIGFGNCARKVTEPVASSTATSWNFSVPGSHSPSRLRASAALWCCRTSCPAHRACRRSFSSCDARLREIDVDGIERADRGERRVLIRRDQRARRDARLADAAGDRRAHRACNSRLMRARWPAPPCFCATGPRPAGAPCARRPRPASRRLRSSSSST